MKSLLLVLFLSAIFISSSFGVGPNLFPLRLLMPIVFVFFGTYLFQKVVLLKQKVKMEPFLLLTFLFFVYTFFHTSIVSYLRSELLGDFYEPFSILNFVFLFFFIVTIYLISISSPKSFLQKTKYLVFVFYGLYGAYALYEIFTGNHLPVSDLYDAPSWMRFAPTVVFNNSNDFAAVFTLMLIYLYAEFDSSKSRSFLFIIGLFLLHVFIVYKTQSRLSLLISFAFFGYRYPKKFVGTAVFGFLLILIMGNFTDNSWYAQLLDDIAKLKSDLSFNERQSTSVRFYLYKYALYSIIPSYGMGFGIDYSAEFYRSINDVNLHYIINPHSFIFELLINSGILATLFYIFINFKLIVKSIISKNTDLIVQIVFFNLLLFSSSSSLFLWPIYLFFIIYICKSCQQTAH
jgi:teichuronic acid biosynthesis protein TuaE